MSSSAPQINRWCAFALLPVAYFMTIVDLTIVNVSLPTIMVDAISQAPQYAWGATRTIGVLAASVALLSTSQQIGGAVGIAIVSSVAASHTQALLHGGTAVATALTGWFQHAFWVLGAIGLLAVPAIFALVQRTVLAGGSDAATVREPQPALAVAN